MSTNTGRIVEVAGKRFVETRFAYSDRPEVQIIRFPIMNSQWYREGAIVRYTSCETWVELSSSYNRCVIRTWPSMPGESKAVDGGTFALTPPRARRYRSIRWEFGRWEAVTRKGLEVVEPDVWTAPSA